MSLIFRESPDLDFATLPDPFGSYIRRIDPREIVEIPDESEIVNPLFASASGGSGASAVPGAKPDAGLDHIEDPAMQTLMQREIAR